MVDMSATIIHHGHIRLLKKASEYGDVIVGLTTDEEIISKKYYQPELAFEFRKEILESIKYVDEAIAQENMDKFSAWEKLKFNIMFVGDDWKNTEKWNQYENQFKSVGVKIVYFPYTKGTSSTILNATLEKLRND